MDRSTSLVVVDRASVVSTLVEDASGVAAVLGPVGSADFVIDSCLPAALGPLTPVRKFDRNALRKRLSA